MNERTSKCKMAGNLCEVEEEEGGATDSEVEKGRWVRTLEQLPWYISILFCA